MKFITATFSYLKRGFFPLALVFLLPAVVCALFTAPLWEVMFISELTQDAMPGLVSTFNIIFNTPFNKVYPLVIIYAAFVPFAAFALSMIERHFRTGRLNFNAPVTLLNNSLFPVITVSLLFFIISVVWRFIILGAVSLTQVICTLIVAGNTSTLIVLAVLCIGLLAVECLFLTSVYLWAPIMIVYGYSLRDAINYSFRLIQKNYAALFLGVLFPNVVIVVLQFLTGLLRLPKFAQIIFSALYMLLLFTYFAAFVMTALFDINKLERRDRKRAYYLR